MMKLLVKFIPLTILVKALWEKPAAIGHFSQCQPRTCPWQKHKISAKLSYSSRLSFLISSSLLSWFLIKQRQRAAKTCS